MDHALTDAAHRVAVRIAPPVCDLEGLAYGIGSFVGPDEVASKHPARSLYLTLAELEGRSVLHWHGVQLDPASSPESQATTITVAINRCGRPHRQGGLDDKTPRTRGTDRPMVFLGLAYRMGPLERLEPPNIRCVMLPKWPATSSEPEASC